MLRRTSVILVLIIALAFLTLYSFAASQTFTGTVTDTMCGKKHMSPGKSDADCTRDCIRSKGDWIYGLVVGDNVYGLTGDNTKFAAFAGQRVMVVGEVSGATITPKTIALAK